MGVDVPRWWQVWKFVAYLRYINGLLDRIEEIQDKGARYPGSYDDSGIKEVERSDRTDEHP